MTMSIYSPVSPVKTAFDEKAYMECRAVYGRQASHFEQNEKKKAKSIITIVQTLLTTISTRQEWRSHNPLFKEAKSQDAKQSSSVRIRRANGNSWRSTEMIWKGLI